MNIVSICAAAVVSSVLAVFLKKQNAELSLIVTLCCITLISAYIISDVVIAISGIGEIVERSAISTEYITVLLKCVGICFMTEFSCDCLRDASQTALANVVSFAGKICVLLASLPLFEEFLTLSLSLCGGAL